MYHGASRIQGRGGRREKKETGIIGIIKGGRKRRKGKKEKDNHGGGKEKEGPEG